MRAKAQHNPLCAIMDNSRGRFDYVIYELDLASGKVCISELSSNQQSTRSTPIERKADVIAAIDNKQRSTGTADYQPYQGTCARTSSKSSLPPMSGCQGTSTPSYHAPQGLAPQVKSSAATAPSNSQSDTFPTAVTGSSPSTAEDGNKDQKSSHRNRRTNNHASRKTQ